MTTAIPDWMIALYEQEIPTRKQKLKVYPPERFVWVCKRREVARNLLALVDASSGEGKVLPRYPRQVHGQWAGPRWVVMAWGLTLQDAHTLQRLAAKLDPSAHGLVWDEEMDNGSRMMKGGYVKRIR